MNETRLHFTRVRAKGESTFYDPDSDIRKVLPAAIKTTLGVLEVTHPDKKAEFLYLYKCFCVFQIRIAEDSMKCKDQVSSFISALTKADNTALALFMHTLFFTLLCIYGLFNRRDAKVDVDDRQSMADVSAVCGVLSNLPPDIHSSVCVPGYIKEIYSTEGPIVCDTTGELIKHAKDIAALFVPSTGDSSWDAISDACDAFFMENEDNPELSDMQRVCIALAYPNYDKSLGVEVDT